MASNLQHDDLIMGGLVGGDRERWQRAKRDILPQHLVGTHRIVYEYGLRYLGVTGSPIDWPSFQQMAATHDSAMGMLLESEYARFFHAEVSEPHFRWALGAVREVRRDERFGDALVEALRAMTEGVGGERGYAVARPLLSAALAEVDRYFGSRNPEGNIRDDLAAVLEEYAVAKATEGFSERMVRTGIAEIDQRIVGLRPGENMLVAAYSGHGKTTFIQNVAWHAAVMQGKNVVILTNENQYEQYRARIYNRHAHHRPNEVGVLGGLNSMALKTGELTPEEEQVWARVCQDFGTQPGYGHLHIVQMPTGASMEWVVGQMDRFADEIDVGLLVLDYIGRLGAMTKRPQRRDELNDNINLWASALVGFDSGRGVPGITGYQTSRDKMREAIAMGGYTLDALAETSEAERNAHIVYFQLVQEDVEGEIVGQIGKNRDGPQMPPTRLVADFATTYITGSTW